MPLQMTYKKPSSSTLLGRNHLQCVKIWNHLEYYKSLKEDFECERIYKILII